MRYGLILIFLVASVSFLRGEDPAPPTPCAKNVSFAIAEGGQPVPAIPKFTTKWLGGKSRRDNYSKICFSQVPSSSLTNYLIVFSTSAKVFEGLRAAAHTYKSAGGASLSSYGGTWSYSYTGVTPPPSTDSLELKRDDKPKSLEARSFDQSGKMVAHYSLDALHSREKLLEQALTDIIRDAPAPGDKKSIASQMPVYYVNCDVDAPPASLAMAPPPSASTAPPAASPSKPPPPPPPKPELDVWSSPVGADIFLDGEYVGKTPSVLTPAAGEHTISLRKKDFGIWQHRITVTPGKRRVGTYLEQKVLALQ